MGRRLTPPLRVALLAAAAGSVAVPVPGARAQSGGDYVAATFEAEVLRPRARPELIGWKPSRLQPPARRPGAEAEVLTAENLPDAVPAESADETAPAVLAAVPEVSEQPDGAGTAQDNQAEEPSEAAEPSVAAVVPGPAASGEAEAEAAAAPAPAAAVPSGPAPEAAPPAVVTAEPAAAPSQAPAAGPQVLPVAGVASDFLPEPVIPVADHDPAEEALMAGRLPAIATRTVDPARFATDRRLLERRRTQATERPQKVDAALDLAQLHIGVMLLTEAKSWLNNARSLGAKSDPAQYARLVALEQVAAVLHHDGITRPLPHWAEGAIWQVAAGQTAGLSRGDYTLEEAIGQLNDHSRPVIARLIPMLFEACLEAGNYRLAEALLRGAQSRTKLEGTPVWHLMMGRLALGYDMPEKAFDHFVRAGEGRDLSAQRARIALADLALARKDPKLLPALRDILTEGVNQWRYGREALILRARLAQVAEDLGNIPLALDIMGKIRLDHPGTPEAVLAHERGALALAAFAVAMEAEEIDLYSYLQSLRNVESFYRHDPVWPIARLALARAWGRAGLHAASAAEYAALSTDLLRADTPEAPPQVAAEIPLGEAEALLRVWQQDRAGIALARAGMPRFEALTTRYAEASLKAGLPHALTQPGGDVAELQHLRAELARSLGLTTEARAAQRALSAAGKLSERPSEALEAVLLAAEERDREFAATAWQDLQKSGAAHEIPPALYDGLTTPLPELRPLSRSLADELLGRSAATAEAARQLLNAPAAAAEAPLRAAPVAAGEPPVPGAAPSVSGPTPAP